MLSNVRNLLIATTVVLVHGGVVFAMAMGKGQVKPPEVIPIALLGTLVATPQNIKPSDGGSVQKPVVQPVVESKPEPVPVLPKPVPEPVKPKPLPETVKPQTQPRPQPRPRQETRPEPTRQPTTAPSTLPVEAAAPAQQATTASQTRSAEQGSASTPAALGVASGAQDAVVAPSFNAGYLRNPKPPYPDMSRRLQEEGRVLLRVLISAEGTAKQVELKQSSGYKRLDDSALSTVKRWRFVPAKRGGQAIEMWYDVPISFSLKG